MNCAGALQTAASLALATVPAVQPAQWIRADAAGNLPKKTQVDWSKFESAVYIQVTRPGEKIPYNCSGVRIKGTPFVLTAAHCVDGTLSGRISSDINPFLETARWETVTSAWIHPEYKPDILNFYRDIAVLCLPEINATGAELWDGKGDLTPQTHIDAIGWGFRDVNARYSVHSTFEKMIDGEIFTEDHQSVEGDSGAPLYVEFNGQQKVIAIHSAWSKKLQESYATSVAGAVGFWINSRACPQSADSKTPFVQR
jgi:hypothetical protein